MKNITYLLLVCLMMSQFVLTRRDLIKKVVVDQDNQESTIQTKQNQIGNPSNRQFCNVKMEMKALENEVVVAITEELYKDKYFVGKFSITASVQEQGVNKECDLLDINRCYSESKEQLGKSAFFKSTNIGGNQLRFSFNFMMGYNVEQDMCYIAVSQKVGEKDFLIQEQVMQYSPSFSMTANKYLSQLDMFSLSNTKSSLSLEDNLKKCAQPMLTTSEIYISDFYRTFEGYLLSKVKHASYFTLRCRKLPKSKQILFRTTNGLDELKKVDVFYTNDFYSEIRIDKSPTNLKIAKMTINEGQIGDNLDPETMHTFTVQAFALSQYKYINYQCYDLDRKNVAKQFITSDFKQNVAENNVEFNFDVAVTVQDNPTKGTQCVVYSIHQVDQKYYVQNDLLMRFKPVSSVEGVTHKKCGAIFLSFMAKPSPSVNVYFLRESRSLGGAVLNAIVNPQAKLYCAKDLSDGNVMAQHNSEMVMKMFYQQAVGQVQYAVRRYQTEQSHNQENNLETTLSKYANELLQLKKEEINPPQYKDPVNKNQKNLQKTQTNEEKTTKTEENESGEKVENKTTETPQEVKKQEGEQEKSQENVENKELQKNLKKKVQKKQLKKEKRMKKRKSNDEDEELPGDEENTEKIVKVIKMKKEESFSGNLQSQQKEQVMTVKQEEKLTDTQIRINSLTEEELKKETEQLAKDRQQKIDMLNLDLQSRQILDNENEDDQEGGEEVVDSENQEVVAIGGPAIEPAIKVEAVETKGVENQNNKKSEDER